MTALSARFTPLKVNISHSLTSSVLKKVNMARITASFGDLIRQMEAALLLSYSAAEPAAALAYQQSGGAPHRAAVTWCLPARHQHTPRLVSAVTRLGGLKLFMYLFARVSRRGKVTRLFIDE